MIPPRVFQETLQEAIAREFQCHRCGNCCKGDGVVHFGAEEADRMAELLGMTRKDFLREFARKIGPEEWRLRDQNNAEQWCIFLQRDADGLYGCRVNPAKPDQCRSFPEKWRNPDSLQSCSGLRALVGLLRERQTAPAISDPS